MTRVGYILHEILPRVNFSHYYLVITDHYHIASIKADCIVNVDILCNLSCLLNVKAKNISLQLLDMVIFLQLAYLTALNGLLELFLDFLWLLVLRQQVNISGLKAICAQNFDLFIGNND